MIRRPPRSTLFPTRRSSDLAAVLVVVLAARPAGQRQPALGGRPVAAAGGAAGRGADALPVLAGQRSEEHTSELQSRQYLVCRLLLEKKKNHNTSYYM